MKTMSSLFEKTQPLMRFYSKGGDFSFEAPILWVHEYHLRIRAHGEHRMALIVNTNWR